MQLPELAEGWQCKSLGELSAFIRGVSFDKSEVRTYPGPGYLRILRAGNIGNSVRLNEDLVWVPERKVSSEQLLTQGDILICMSSGSPEVVGKTAQLKQTWVGSVGAFCGIVRAREGTNPDYLAYWFRSSCFSEWRDRQARGANIQNLRFSQLAKIPVALPRPDQQRRIVTRIDELLGRIDHARALLAAARQEAESLLSSAMTQLFATLDNGVVPRECLGNLCHVCRGGSPRPKGDPKFFGGDIPWIMISDATQAPGKYLRKTQETLTHEGMLRSRYLEPGTLIVTNSATIGLPKILGIGGCIHDGFLAFLDLSPRLDCDYLYWFLHWKRKDLARLAPHGTQKNLNTGIAKRVEIPLPPIDEQQRIVSQLDRLQGQAEELQHTQEETHAGFDILTQAILAQAFRGQL